MLWWSSYSRIMLTSIILRVDYDDSGDYYCCPIAVIQYLCKYTDNDGDVNIGISQKATQSMASISVV